MIDSVKYSLRVTDARMERALKALAEMSGLGVVARTAFESLIGQLVSMRPAVGPVQLFTRGMYSALTAAPQWKGNRSSGGHDRVASGRL